MNVQSNILLRLFMVSGLPSRFFFKFLMKEFCMWITDSFPCILPGFKMYSEWNLSHSIIYLGEQVEIVLCIRCLS